MKKHALASLLLIGSMLLSSCSHEMNHSITRNASKFDMDTIYLTGDPQEIADDVFEMICDAEDIDDLKKLVSPHGNVMGSTLKDTLKTLDGHIDDEECVYIDVNISTPDENKKNGTNHYSIHCFYYLTVDDEEYILEFEVVLVSEYEVNRHGLNILCIEEYDDFNLNDHRKDYVTPDMVKGHEVQEYVQTIYADHHKKVMHMDEGRVIPEMEELMEEILYCLEEEDDDELLDLYSDDNVNSRDDIDDYKEDEVDKLMDVFGGEDLSAVGSVIQFQDYSLKPTYVDCDDVDDPLEYIGRYIISDGDDEYKIQVIYIPYSLSEDYWGIQSITFVEE